MIRFAAIGTSMITGRFLEKAQLVPEVKVTTLCSRSRGKAEQLGEPYGIEVYVDTPEALAQNPDIDAVYIASPNSLHFEQAMQMLRAGKHVLCEKPMASNRWETEIMLRTAKENGVVLMEALRTLHDPAFQAIKEHMGKLGRIRKACLEYCQYSSRYDLLLKGQVTNIFDPKFSAGAMQDIGVYCTAAMVDLFGVPESTHGFAVVLPNGIDGCGSIQAVYDGMIAEISYSKITRSDNCSQIQGEKGTMYIDSLPGPQKIWIVYTNGTREEIAITPTDWNMNYEIDVMAQAIQGKADISYYQMVTVETARILENTKKQIGLVFPADTEKKPICMG